MQNLTRDKLGRFSRKRLHVPIPANGTQPAKRVGSRLLQFDSGTKTAVQRNELIGIFNPHYVGIRQFRQMLLYPMIQFGLAIRRSAIINLRWKVEGRDPEIIASLTAELNQHYRSFALSASNAIGLGRVIIEPVMQIQDHTFDMESDDGDAKEVTLPNAWVIRRLKNIRPETITFLIEDDELSGVEQTIGRRKARVPKDEIIVWSYRKEDVNGDLRGAAILRSTYEPWWHAISALLFGNRYMERKGEGVWKGRAQREITRSDGETEDGYAVMGEAIQAFRNDSLLVLPTLVDEFGNFLFDFELMQDDKRGDMIQAWIDARDLSMLRSILIMGNAATSAEGEGSRAMAETHERTMEGPLETDVMEFLDDVLNPQFVTPWVRTNYGLERAAAARTRVTSGGISGATRDIFAKVIEKVLDMEAMLAEGEAISLAEMLNLKDMAKELGLSLKTPKEIKELMAAKQQRKDQMVEEMRRRPGVDDDEEIDDRDARDALIRRGQAPDDDEE